MTIDQTFEFLAECCRHRRIIGEELGGGVIRYSTATANGLDVLQALSYARGGNPHANPKECAATLNLKLSDAARMIKAGDNRYEEGMIREKLIEATWPRGLELPFDDLPTAEPVSDYIDAHSSQ